MSESETGAELCDDCGDPGAELCMCGASVCSACAGDHQCELDEDPCDDGEP